jgi:hypothetical protein
MYFRCLDTGSSVKKSSLRLALTSVFTRRQRIHGALLVLARGVGTRGVF